MDLIETIVASAHNQRSELIWAFAREHSVCWPGPQLPFYDFAKPMIVAKCSCGAQLEVVILTKLVVNSYQPK